MILYPNCKINLGLRVIRKREDGYHDLETVFVPIYGLHDELEVTTLDDHSQPSVIRFQQEGITVDCAPEDNLIVKCYRLMATKYPQIGSVSVRFRKNIPFGAGLGGGSSDAAHMALALNDLFSLGLSHEQLANDVRPLGADCPFFIYNTPCYAEGIGDLLSPIDLDMSSLRILMIKPDEGVSTREAYSGIIRHPEVTGQIRELVMPDVQDALSIKQADMLNTQAGQLPCRDILSQHGDCFINDFEQTVFPLHPTIAHIKQRLLDAGALYAGMSGSGSTVYGFFEDDAEGRSLTGLRMLEKEFAAMILLNDTLAKR
ncbi:MAG: 4-(cytidine 5'-diphospho)-2-C-methyl-D-erythritol kinase [Paludibacteraceae bacterium]|nr:4-(cytidine 5'-diphospho)-2-C-methyl-D-erythritol kinase [Paludibacteraceae bacterium]